MKRIRHKSSLLKCIGEPMGGTGFDSEPRGCDDLWALYVHVPFCLRKCPYCAFPSAPLTSESEGAAYLTALEQEIDRWRQHWGCLPVLDSLYVGGGTPTVLSPHQWSHLMALLDVSFPRTSETEISVEANPGTLTKTHLDLWRSWGVTRVSVGIQSLDDAELQLLGRTHSAAQARDALASSVSAGFHTCADLMFGLPYQTLPLWYRTLHEVLHLGVGHVSVYQLTLEPGTPWGNEPPAGLPDGYPFYRFAQWYLTRKGFSQYEVASFSRPGRTARHNFSYWEQRNVLGLGPGAWSYQEGHRWRNPMTLSAYRHSLEDPLAFYPEKEYLFGENRSREAAILALRTSQGINLRACRRRFGAKALANLVKIADAFSPTYLTAVHGHLRLTPRGWRVANQIWGAIWNDLPPDAPLEMGRVASCQEEE